VKLTAWKISNTYNSELRLLNDFIGISISLFSSNYLSIVFGVCLAQYVDSVTLFIENKIVKQISAR
jgi:hypothetical protein